MNRLHTSSDNKRGLSSPTRRSATQAWFALGVNAAPRDKRSWSSDLLMAYDAGYEDAIRALESGVVGVGNEHCEFAHVFLISY